MTDIGRTALDYAERGWPVIPLHHPMTTGCSCRQPGCGSPGKHPRVRGGLNAATVDASQVGAWWTRWPRANIGVRTGDPSGLVVVDIDPPHGGNDTLARLMRRHGQLPETFRVETGSGGAHLYFSHPGGRVGNDAGRRLGPGIDIRGDGGYIVAPPSLHASGHRYRHATQAALAPLPDWMRERLIERAPRQVTRRVDYEPGFARRAMDRATHAVTHAPVGTRNNTLNRAAYRLGRLVDDGVLDRRAVEGVLEVAAAAAGLSVTEARKTIRSAVDAATHSAQRSPNRSVDLERGRALELPGLPSL